MVGHDFSAVRAGERGRERTQPEHVVEGRVDKALLAVLGHGHGRGAEVLLGQLEDLFPDAGLVARVDLVGELLDQLGVDLHLGRRECGRQVAANGGAGGGGRRGGRGGGRLRYRDRSLRAVGRGAREGGGGGGGGCRRPP